MVDTFFVSTIIISLHDKTHPLFLFTYTKICVILIKTLRLREDKMQTNKDTIKKMVVAAMFLSIGFVLPIFTSQIKEIGDTLLPMHIPVMLCGLICGAKYGFFVGLLLPLLRGFVFGMPPIYPNAVWMAIELATYGLVIGFLYYRMKNKNLKGIYVSLVSAMLLGRVAWGISKVVLLGLSGKAFTISMFIAGGFIDALPGIIIQLVLIPLIMEVLNRKGVIF